MKTTQVCPDGSPGEKHYKRGRLDGPPSSTMPPTSPRIAQEVFDALLFTPFHDNVTIYPDDVYVAAPRQENFRSPMTVDAAATTYVSVLSAGRPLSAKPVSTTMQGSFPLPDVRAAESAGEFAGQRMVRKVRGRFSEVCAISSEALRERKT